MELIQYVMHELMDPHNTFAILLMIMVGIWTTGRIFAKMHLPPVLGEILAGIIIGPAFLGLIQPTEAITIMAELGVFFIMFHSGIDTDPRELLKSSKASIAIAVGGVGVLFSLGTLIMHLFGFPVMTSIFMGAVLSVTSFPVISRILKDMKLNKTKFGHTILAATVVDDIIAFMLISVVVAMVNTGTATIGSFIFVLVKVFLFFAGTLFLGSKILPKFKIFLNKTGTKGFTFSLIVALVFGVFAELIGLHMILGAYLGGIFLREEIENQKMFQKIEDRYFGIAHSFLGPIFFASIGMMVTADIFQNSSWFVIILILTVFIGQWVGSGAAAYFFGKMDFQESSAVALGLSGRGVMEIILAKIGYDTWVTLENGTTERLLSQELFSSVVVVAIVTTFAAPFFLRWLVPEKYLKKAK